MAPSAVAATEACIVNVHRYGEAADRGGNLIFHTNFTNHMRLA
jgi:hypothetical protein